KLHGLGLLPFLTLLRTVCQKVTGKPPRPFANVPSPSHPVVQSLSAKGPNMKTLLTARFAILLTCSLLLSAHSSAQSPAVPIQDFFKSYFEENLKDEPENATGVGRHDYDDRWSDLSNAGRDAHLAHLRSRLADLNKYDFAKLSEQDQLSARLLNYDLTSQIESNDISTHLLRVGQLYGF